ncbi:EF-hand calcium-binding domain-containing protein 10 [Exaiptasia diaphana]|uniref:EF-hand domain-containing protein n=1 Tax=Exaiptasia diaphana TaxID=2652724 RepID=A0A913WW58_EXADI|nr:EF-hand calcium-binding domain-containing protein 10 [Exaiptasia diaphana]KXJ17422.1 EF-hand calcium-binding domain-containing protein 10 [Exaiptasia diaphana]
MAGKEELAKQYLKRHKIMELLDNLTAQLIYERPGNPKEYMCNYLEKLKTGRTVQRGYPCLFDDTNIRSLFGMLDVTGNGFITFEQYKEGLDTLGVERFDKNPSGADIDKISGETFLKEARQGLLQSSATFSS